MARAIAMALAQAQMSSLSPNIALANIGPYISRGHGGRHSFVGSSRNTVAQAKRAAIKARNRVRNKAAHRG